jgi:hypothetical protein
MLFEGPGYLLGSATFGRTYDIAPDDSRFLFVKQEPLKQGDTRRIIVVQNWFEDSEAARAPP